MSETIDLVPFLSGAEGAEEIPVQVGDLLSIGAQSSPMWLPAIFQEDTFVTLERFTRELREKLRLAGVHTTITGADVFDDEDDVRHVELELQVTFVGPLPIQLDAEGDFYGYDDEGNLLSRDQFWDQAIEDLSIEGGIAGTVGGRGGPGWTQIVFLAVAAASVVSMSLLYATAETLTNPEAHEPVREISSAVKTVSVAAAVIALVYLLSKA